MKFSIQNQRRMKLPGSVNTAELQNQRIRRGISKMKRI